MSESEHASMTFEQALDGLETVVARLESGEVGLEEAVALFEEGQRLLGQCRDRLAVAKGRIDELTAQDVPRTDTATAEDPFDAER